MRSRNEILDLLTVHREELRREFGVESLALFGSAARNEALPASDIDILVDIPGPITLFGLAALRLHLEEILGVDRVDVVMRDAIYPPLRDAIIGEAINIV
jgi:predicted nucleotidyltransferase